LIIALKIACSRQAFLDRLNTCSLSRSVRSSNTLSAVFD
jgi:hypothetical protein